MAKITKDMLISDIIAVDRRLAMILAQHGMHCVGWRAAQYESLAEACQVHGMSPEDGDKMVETMNAFIEKANEIEAANIEE